LFPEKVKIKNAELLARRSRQPKMSNIAVRATAIRIGENAATSWSAITGQQEYGMII
jgi:hypothetical protein